MEDLQKKTYNFQEGEVLLINKPYKWTSFSVVNKIRYLLKHYTGNKKIKVGHAGTLDPLATGLLIICTGKFTKQIDSYQGLEKEYTGTITLGVSTPSFDLETKPDHVYSTDHITEALIHETAKKFIGKIEQTPPVYSAIKIDGKRAYEYARKNQDVKLNSKIIEIFDFKITEIEMPKINFRVVCSKGTYIRSLANDFGIKLNCGAHLSALKRTRIGSFNLEDSLEIDTFKETLISLKKKVNS